MKESYYLRLRLLHRLKTVSFPGFNKYPIYEVGRFFVKGIAKGMIGQRAASVAYSTFLALFPAIIFFFSVIPYVPIENFQPMLLEVLQKFLPENAFLTIEDTITDIITNQRGSLLSLTFFFTIFFASNGILSLIKAFNSSYHAIEYRKWWTRRLVAIALVFIQFLLVTVAIALLSVTVELYHRYFDAYKILWYLFIFFRIIIVLALFFFSVSFVYYLAPARRGRFRFFTPGASLATFLIVVSSFGFSFFVNNFGQYNKLYGSIGTVMVVLIWIFIMSFAFIIGFELNASIIHRRRIEEDQ